MLESRRNVIWNNIYKEFQNRVNILNNLYSHPGVKGSQNEKALAYFLKSFLPSKYEVKRNIILLDRDGNESTEQDLVIWNKVETPRVFSTLSYFLIDTILASIEVKTILNKKKLEETLIKIRDLRKMNYLKKLDGEKKWQIHPPLCFIYAYDCIWKKKGALIKTIKSIINENNIIPSERFDYLYIMKKGIKVNWDYADFLPDGRVSTPESREGLFKEIAVVNPRWPQLFPCRLKKEIPLPLSEMQVHQEEESRKGYYSKLTVESQIRSIVKFLSDLCQAIEDHNIMHPYGIIALSYSTPRHNWGGISSERF